MFKNLSWPIIIVIFSVLITLVVVFAGIILMEIDKVTSAKAETVDVSKEKVMNDIYIETTQKDADYYTSKIEKPITNIRKADKDIQFWIDEIENKFTKDMMNLAEDKQVTENDHDDFHLAINVEPFVVNEKVISFMLKGSIIENDKETSAYNKVVTINVDTNKIIYLSDVIDENDEFIDYLITEIESLDVLDHFQESNVKEYVQKNKKINWFVTEDELIVLFPPDSLGEHENIIDIALPYIEIYPYITEDYYNKFITNEMQEEIDNEPEEIDPNGKYIALTFDDGPDEHVTEDILSTLDEYDAKATFFMLGSNAQKYPEVAKAVKEAGHEVANHTITHRNLNTTNIDKIKEEMVTSQEQIRNASGVTPKIFRPPYGEYNENVIEIAKQSNQIITMWTIDTQDWKNKTANSIVNKVSHSRPGDIILMHDIHPTTAEALPAVIEYLQEQGFEFVTVSEMLQLEENMEVGPYYGTNDRQINE